MHGKVTIVIPSHERHELLERALRYYDSFDLPIVVVDSSERPIDPSPYRNVDYIHCPNEPLPHKLRKPILERVTTPFMFFSADDIFISENAAKRCVDFLEANPDYSSAQGYHIGFSMDRNDDQLSIYYRGLDNLDTFVDSNRPEERLIQLFTRYTATFYAVFRSDCIKLQFEKCPAEITNYCLSEFYCAMMTAIHGKHEMMPMFYALQEVVPIVHGLNPVYRNDMHRLATLPRYHEEFEAVLATVADCLSGLSGRSLDEARLFVMKGVALQSWQRKKDKGFKDRLEKEWRSFMNKTFDRKGYQERKRKQREESARADRLLVQTVLDRIGGDGRRELDALLARVKGESR